MIGILDTICKASFTLVSNISNYKENIEGTVSITGQFTELEIVKGPNSTFSYTTSESNHGNIHNVSGTLRLKSVMEQYQTVIFKIELDNGSVYIIGSPFNRVQLTRTNNRDGYTLGFSINQAQKPFLLG